MTGINAERPFQVFHRARELLSAKRYREAHSLCRSTVLEDRSNADAFYVMGIIAYEHKDFDRALKLFELAIEQSHPEAGPLVQAARCLVFMNTPERALHYVEAATKIEISDGYTLASVAALLSRLDRHEDAIVFHRKATEVSPNDSLNFYNLGSSLLFIGETEAAKEAYQRSLEIQPQFSPARVRLAQLVKHTPDSNHLHTLKQAWDARHPQDIEVGLQLAHALAKVHEDLDNLGESMAWLDRGKALVRTAIPSRRGQDDAAFKAAIALIGRLSPHSQCTPGGPIFVLGLPRTGTTLVDRILSSHSQVVSAGERPEFGTSLFEAVNPSGTNMDFAEAIEGAESVDLVQVGSRYLNRLKKILRTDARFTDKMPINILFAPVILSAIPSAKIVCLRRHPADSVLSMYRQLFDLNAQHYRCTHDLSDLAHYVVRFRSLLDELAGRLPKSRFQVVDYETLATETEPVVRKLLEFCDLGFEEACLNFQGNTAPTATASVTQVRQPMYTSSIARWKKYRGELKPALDILRAHELVND